MFSVVLCRRYLWNSISLRALDLDNSGVQKGLGYILDGMNEGMASSMVSTTWKSQGNLEKSGNFTLCGKVREFHSFLWKNYLKIDILCIYFGKTSFISRGSHMMDQNLSYSEFCSANTNDESI